jgi:hypothetical protein
VTLGDARLTLARVAADSIVTVDGRAGLFTPFVGDDPADVKSTANLEEVVDALRNQVAHLQSANADLSAKLDALESPSRSSDDLASGVQHALDGLQDQLAAMANPTSNFAVREFTLETKVHVDVTALGTIGFRFVQPGETVNAAALSTVSLTVVPLPKPVLDEPVAPVPADAPVEAIDGLTPAQLAALRGAHVTTASSFRKVATRATASASRFTLLAGLLAVPDLDRQRAAVLFDAGITDAGTLAAADPAALVKAYTKAAKARTDDDGFRPTADDAAAWIAAAAALSPAAP